MPNARLRAAKGTDTNGILLIIIQQQPRPWSPELDDPHAGGQKSLSSPDRDLGRKFACKISTRVLCCGSARVGALNFVEAECGRKNVNTKSTLSICFFISGDTVSIVPTFRQFCACLSDGNGASFEMIARYGVSFRCRYKSYTFAACASKGAPSTFFQPPLRIFGAATKLPICCGGWRGWIRDVLDVLRGRRGNRAGR